eukprot:gnl/MRDRNA2_/MRDRNA2_35231_c0_seq2.p1 gnl/MRDRNA2_/MRDRNA2_35231_c0~~gnl/MRDRNA2_/MRDRNA2_35231_c0_seq2.p1  ORF type:complete len:191 (+),score=23.91 gnl/MRDRNA2_/MRDRNA2_35231_c0_seq2:58-573(+)
MAAPEYRLAVFRVVYTARLRNELTFTIQNLKRSLEWSNEPWPTPRRLPRRAASVTYLKSPFVHKTALRHYIFHDWRYAFTFRNVSDPRKTISTALGAMSPDTSCVCHFSWHSGGDPEYTKFYTEDEAQELINSLEQGFAAVQKKQEADIEREKSWYAASMQWNTGLKSSTR